jgi:hypothetical protein
MVDMRGPIKGLPDRVATGACDGFAHPPNKKDVVR